MQRARFLVWLAIVATPMRAQAEDGPAGGEQARQDESHALFMEGRRLLLDGLYLRAADSLRRAIERWDNPAARLHLAKALLNLDQPVDALMHMWTSMRFAGDARDMDAVESVERWSEYLLEEELARLVIENDVDERVHLSGVAVLGGRGQWEGVVRAGAVTILAGGERPASTFELAPGASTHVRVTKTAVERSREGRIGPAEVESLQLALVGFDVVFPSLRERVRWAAARRDAWVDPSDELPPVGAAACARPKHPDGEAVCRAWAAERRALVAVTRREHDEGMRAILKLKELLSGWRL